MPAVSDEALASLARRSREVWGFEPEPAALAVWVREHASERAERLDPGLALACALFHRHPEAGAAFERVVAPRVHGALRKLGTAQHEAEESLQCARTRLLVEEGGARLKTYRGLGNFEAFVTTTAVRAWSATRQLLPVVTEDEQLARLPAAVDLEKALARLGQKEHFAAAFATALAALSARERGMLRLNLVDGASIDELAPMYLVSRATIARWLAAAKQALHVRTLSLLSERTRLKGFELDGLMASLESGFDLSLRRLVVEAASGDGPP